jgi:mannose-6-phosphate isomerase-like protein (cupin superfamily)
VIATKPQILHRLSPNVADFDLLYQRQVNLHQSYDYTDWKGIVVRKPWGYEYEWYAHAAMAIWFLHIRQGFSTSFHCHPRKGTSLLVIGGAIEVRSVKGTVAIEAGSVIFIEPATFHQSTAMSAGGAFLLEIESPPIKEDLVRVEDKYGRAGFGYEGDDAFSNEHEKHGYRPLMENLDGDKRFTFLERSLVHAAELRNAPPPPAAAGKSWGVCLDRQIPRGGKWLEIGEIFALKSASSANPEMFEGEYLFF